MAEFIGVDTEQMIIPYYDWSYIPDSNEDEIPDIVEEQIYEDPLSVDDEWLEDEYSSLIVEEYSAPMKKELVEVLYLSKTSKISNFTDIKDLLLMAIKGGYQKFIQLKTSINKAIKTIELNIYGHTIEVDTGDKPSEILNIVDCINTNTKEFKIAYDRLGDMDKAYEIVNKIKDGQFLGEIVKETANYNDYKNFYGKQARIPKQSASDRQNAVDTILKNAEAGKVTKGEISEAKTFQDIIENDLGTVESFCLKVFDF